uniref:Uncharacterized protein n=1 Tax=Marmota marmota marmota TaxID=9994 RepID=A0A8C5ZV90_MARMA
MLLHPQGGGSGKFCGPLKLIPGKFLFGGIKKYFNSYTCTPSRMICVQATYRGNALMILYFKLRSKNFYL